MKDFDPTSTSGPPSWPPGSDPDDVRGLFRRLVDLLRADRERRDLHEDLLDEQRLAEYGAILERLTSNQQLAEELAVVVRALPDLLRALPEETARAVLQVLGAPTPAKQGRLQLVAAISLAFAAGAVAMFAALRLLHP